MLPSARGLLGFTVVIAVHRQWKSWTVKHARHNLPAGTVVAIRARDKVVIAPCAPCSSLRTFAGAVP